MCLACGERCRPALSQCSKAQASKARHLPHQPLENGEEAGGGQTKDQAMRQQNRQSTKLWGNRGGQKKR